MAQGRCGAHFKYRHNERVIQAAVAWVLAATFVRFHEDNDLLEQVLLDSKDPGGRGADQSLRAFFSDKPAPENLKTWRPANKSPRKRKSK